MFGGTGQASGRASAGGSEGGGEKRRKWRRRDEKEEEERKKKKKKKKKTLWSRAVGAGGCLRVRFAVLLRCNRAPRSCAKEFLEGESELRAGELRGSDEGTRRGGEWRAAGTLCR